MHSRQIESFIETADAGSFNQAARKLYITPSSLIQQIDLLEQRLGITLFKRSRRGVELTEAGESLYQDAVDIVRRCNEAVARARSIQRGEGSIRVATSLLMKCRMLPEIWPHMIEGSPDIRIDIISLESVGVEPGNYLQGLGISYDVMEGLFMSEIYRDRCLLLELAQVPLCVALPKTMDAAACAVVDATMLQNLDLVVMKPGVSAHYDAVHAYLSAMGADRIEEVPFYTMELFADCELNKRAIVTVDIWQDIHPDLVCVPLAQRHTIPYGLIFSSRPNAQTMKLYRVAADMR